MNRPIGLRTQLLLGLVIIIVVATVSVGAMTAWATRWQLAQQERAGAEFLGRGVARLLGGALESEQPQRELGRVLDGLALWDGVRGIRVLHGDGRMLAQRGRSRRPLELSTVGVVVHSGAPRVVAEADAIFVTVAVPVRGRFGAAVMLELPSSRAALGWPLLFWVLMGLDGLALVLFVGHALTRYVVRPVVRMQQAALRVTAGELSTQIEPQGAMELASLADSFNSMTRAMQRQLERLEGQRLQLIATREQVIRSEKLASVGRLAAGVAHEVGNPLQAIVGYTELLLRPGVGGAQQQDFLERVQRETQRIQRIIRELLDYARPVEDAVEAVSLAAVVEQTLQLVRPQRRLREVIVECAGLEALPLVAANASRLVQVLLNLLLNAADAMALAGTIRVAGERRGDLVALTVDNDGEPIPVSDRGRIFDPFFTTKDPGEGTGLGLSVAQSIVESYGGRLQLEQAERTRFVITLHPFGGPES